MGTRALQLLLGVGTSTVPGARHMQTRTPRAIHEQRDGNDKTERDGDDADSPRLG